MLRCFMLVRPAPASYVCLVRPAPEPDNDAPEPDNDASRPRCFYNERFVTARCCLPHFLFPGASYLPRFLFPGASCIGAQCLPCSGSVLGPPLRHECVRHECLRHECLCTSFIAPPLCMEHYHALDPLSDQRLHSPALEVKPWDCTAPHSNPSTPSGCLLLSGGNLLVLEEDDALGAAKLRPAC